MMRCLLIRHAETHVLGHTLAGRAPGCPLSASGRRQAERLARRLAAERIDAVYSSPQERALETAQVIAAASALEARVAAELDEIDYGDWTGRTFDELRALPEWRSFNTLRSCARIPRGETMVSAQARVVGFLTDIAAEPRELCAAVVSHADVIRAALSYYLGMPLDLMLRFEVSPASLSVLDFTGSGPLIRCINAGEPPCR